MDATTIYAITAGGLLLLLCCINLLNQIRRHLQRRFVTFMLKHVVYPYIIQRHRLLVPRTRFEILLYISYWTATALCSAAGVSDLNEAGSRAAALAVIHYIPLYSTPHLTFIADLLALSFRTWRQMHAAMGTMASILSVLHVITVVRRRRFSLHDDVQRFGFIVSGPLLQTGSG